MKASKGLLFLERKRSKKNFNDFALVLLQTPAKNTQKFFASFFQKRSAFLSLTAFFPGLAYAADSCTAMKNFSWPDTAIEQAKLQNAGPLILRAMMGPPVTVNLPEHCVVTGVIAPYRDHGVSYGVRFELRLPKDWNGRFLFQGGGGLDGSVQPALGSAASGGPPALTRGFAVVSMDGGHEGPDASFASSQQARLDFAYQAVGKTTQFAKAAVAHYYTRQPDYSYFEGCSNGGREAMIAAQRYPLEFNGIVAGDPGFRLAHAAVAEAWNNAHYAAIAPKGPNGLPDVSRAFSDADLKLVADAVLARCDALDGLKDGLVSNPDACHFSPQTLACKPGQSASCLPQAKIDALEAVMGGAHDSKDAAIYSGFPYDPGIATPGWRLWMLGIPGKIPAMNEMLGGPSLSLYFLTPQQPGRDVHQLDFDRAAENIASTAAINDADSLMLSSFHEHGGKLLIYQGGADPVFSAADIEDWYRHLQSADASASGYARLFMVPGMTHCGGGYAPDQFDALGAVQAWVEKHQQPQRILATGIALQGQSRPLCAWPAYAHYTGGDAKLAASFQCVTNKETQ